MVDPTVRFIAGIVVYVLIGLLLTTFTLKLGRFISREGATVDNQTLGFFGMVVTVVGWFYWALSLMSLFRPS